MSEEVAVVPRALVEQCFPGQFPGFMRWTGDTQQAAGFKRVIDNIVFMSRERAETNENWLQTIPYLLLWDPDRYLMATYFRSKKSGEERLRRKASVGFGGHMNERDFWAGPQAAFYLAAFRELHEELSFDPPLMVTGPQMHLHGLIALDETVVDRVHLGFVIQVDVTSKISANDDEVEWLEWKRLNGALLELDNLEKWSYHVIKEALENRIGSLISE